MSSSVLASKVESCQFLKNPIYLNVMNIIHDICIKQGVDDSHGLKHAIQIALHVHFALKSKKSNRKEQSNDCLNQKQENNEQNIILASLLHDIDDYKYFKTENFQNARNILQTVLLQNQQKDFRIEKIIYMISLVSFSKNGNNIYPTDPIQYYFPRYADRVQATGLIGIHRSWQYSAKVGQPFFLPSTLLPNSRQQLYSFMKGRDQQYISRGGKSLSLIDHLMDKPLHIRLPKQIQQTNQYLRQLYQQGHEIIEDFVLQNANNDGYKNGEKDLYKKVEQMNEGKEKQIMKVIDQLQLRV